MARPGTYVRIAQGAESDLRRIWRRRPEQRGAEGVDGADALLDALVSRIESLADFPKKGTLPAELEALGIFDYRQVSHPPFRIIYHLAENGSATATVLIVADARRDFRELLEQRLLTAGS